MPEAGSRGAQEVLSSPLLTLWARLSRKVIYHPHRCKSTDRESIVAMRHGERWNGCESYLVSGSVIGISVHELRASTWEDCDSRDCSRHTGPSVHMAPSRTLRTTSWMCLHRNDRCALFQKESGFTRLLGNIGARQSHRAQSCLMGTKGLKFLPWENDRKVAFQSGDPQSHCRPLFEPTAAHIEAGRRMESAR